MFYGVGDFSDVGSIAKPYGLSGYTSVVQEEVLAILKANR